MKFVSLVFLAGLLGVGDAVFKKWKANTNFENPSNWAGGRLPCPNDRVRFPEKIGTVFMQTNTTITEIVLPVTGELVLGSYMSIAFPVRPSTDPGCPSGQEKTFKRTSALSWFDPTQWCVTSHADGDCRADQPAMLDSERVPCRTDTAVFPAGNTFLVSLAYGTDVYTGGLLLDGKSYTSASFKRFLQTSEGGRQFVRTPGSPPTTVTVNSDQCTDPTGCPCGNDRGTIFDKICATMTGTCPEPNCTHPIQAMGSCCSVCGAVLKLDYSSYFRKEKLKNLILSKYKHGDVKYKDLRSVVSKLTIGQIQVLLTDGGSGDIASEVGELLKDYLIEDASDDNKYGISDVNLKESQNVQPTHAAQTGKPLSNGSVASIIIVILVILVVVVLIYFFIIQKKRVKLPDLKATFTNLGRGRDRAELELGSTNYGKSVLFDDSLHGFDNPMYGDAAAKGEIPVGVQSVSKDEYGPSQAGLPPTFDGSTTNFSNPLYGSGPIEVDFQPLGEPSETSATSRQTLAYPDANEAGFSNPLYTIPSQEIFHPASGQNGTMTTGQFDTAHHPPVLPIQSSYGPSVMVMNPIFSMDGADIDSQV